MAREHQTFAQFWPFYLREHSKPRTRALHFAGTSLVVAILLFALVTGRWWLLVAVPIAGYGFAWVAHLSREEPPGDVHLSALVARRRLQDVVAVADRTARAGARARRCRAPGQRHVRAASLIRSIALAAAAAVALAGCATGPSADPQTRFMARLASLCGQAFSGRLVTSDPADADMARQPLVMHVASCTANQVRIPFQVGDDRSRTWVITRTPSGLRLKHDHRHEDGSPDAVTMYGGDTAGPGTAARQEFPVDAESIALFRANKLERSVTNVWAVEVTDTMFAYELRRPAPNSRHFRAEFDLTRPVPPPPLPWGWGR